MATMAETLIDLEACIRLDKPAFIWSPPGCGKSEGVHQLAGAASARVIDVRLSTFDPVDLRGLPAIMEGLTEWIRPKLWPVIEGENCYIFFDEMDRAPTSVANAALQIVLEKRIGEHVFPRSTRIVAAGNGATDRGTTNKIGGAQANRFTHLYATPDAETAARHFEATGRHPVFPAFFRYRPNLIHTGTAKRTDESPHAFASPRAWSTCEAFISEPDSVRTRLISGTVGNGEAHEFEAFYRTWRELPPIASLIADPDNSPVFTAPGACYAVSGALARAATIGNFGNVIRYLDRMQKEFAVMAVTSAVRRDQNLAETSAYVQWAIRNQHVQ